MVMTTGNLVPLDAELKEQFQQLFRAVKRNTITLAKQAYQIHSEHYSRTNRRYDKNFEVWWEAQGLEQVFGSRGNWTKWYRAGEALEKVHAQFDKYTNKLPTTREALYEIALLQPDELRLCLENKYSRSSVTQPEAEWKRPKRLQPVINPAATASSIRSWRKNWREPRQPRADKRTLPFITIHIHRSLYDFDKSGQPAGVIAAGQAVEINQKIIDLLKPLDAFVRIDSKLEHLLEGYDKRRVAAEKRTEKAKKRRRPSRKGPRKRASHVKI
jgi:hypothetical protein